MDKKNNLQPGIPSIILDEYRSEDEPIALNDSGEPVAPSGIGITTTPNIQTVTMVEPGPQTAFEVCKWYDVLPKSEFRSGEDFLYADWASFLNSIVFNQEYYNFDFVLPRPQRVTEKDTSNVVSPYYYSAKSQYNFFVDGYETAIESVPERLLPNSYVFDIHSYSSKVNKRFEALITLSKNIEYKVKNPTGEYFDLYKKKIASYALTEAANIVGDMYKNTIFPLADIEGFMSRETDKWSFPMFNSVDFSTDVSTEVAELLAKTGLMNILMSNISSCVETGNFFTNQRMKISGQDVNLRSFNIMVWFDVLKSLLDGDVEDEIFRTFSGKETDTTSYISERAFREGIFADPKYKLNFSVSLFLFAKKIEYILKDRARSFLDVFNKQKAPSETILYRIEKTDSEGVIQNYYLPNSNKIDILKFVDTQVKYAKRYKYKVYAYQFVLGTKYKFFDAQNNGTSGRICVQDETVVRILEVPYFEQELMVYDAPPVSPEVVFWPYKDINNRVSIVMNGGLGTREEKPVILEISDEEQERKMREVQEIPEKEEKITYSSDDNVVLFDIYRIEKHPEKYEDFRNNRVSRVSTSISSITNDKATSATFKDEIEPNKKYYYVVRTVDVHSHVSNPSPIFQVEMVDDGGTVWLLTECVELKKTAERQKSISFRKKLHMVPSLKQVLVDLEKNGLSGVETGFAAKDIVLGVTEDSVWGKTFKIRIVSKQSNRKIDFNVSFVPRFDRNTTKIEENK